jgi:hypothetical protein
MRQRRMKQCVDILVIVALLAIPPSLSRAESLDARPYGACAGAVQDHLADGGLVFRLTGRVSHEGPIAIQAIHLDPPIGNPTDHLDSGGAFA